MEHHGAPWSTMEAMEDHGGPWRKKKTMEEYSTYCKKILTVFNFSLLYPYSNVARHEKMEIEKPNSKISIYRKLIEMISILVEEETFTSTLQTIRYKIQKYTW